MAKAKEAFEAMYSILYLKAVGTSEDRAAAVQEAMRALREVFVSERALIEYFDNTWAAKWSAPLLQSKLYGWFERAVTQRHPRIMGAQI
jgi:hypothetical protein